MGAAFDPLLDSDQHLRMGLDEKEQRTGDCEHCNEQRNDTYGSALPGPLPPAGQSGGVHEHRQLAGRADVVQ